MNPEKKKKIFKYGFATIALLAVSLLLSFGTLSPCGIAKKMIVRQMMEDQEMQSNPFAGLGVMMVDRMVDSMSPPRCAYGAVRMAFGAKMNGRKDEKPFEGREADTAEKESSKVDAADISDAEKDYIKKIELYDFEAKYRSTYLDERVVGVDFKLKNKGDRSLSRVEITVYFKSKDGMVIAEENFTPVLVSKYSFSGDNKPLKPNYIWQQERNHFYTAKNVPSEWKEGSAYATITDVKFLEEEK